MPSEQEPTAGLSAVGPGALLGHFELIDSIGGGGMGRVFRATDTRLGRTVALKVLSRQQAADVETLLRFHNEARASARLNHENIAQVYYVGEDKGLPFIAGEFVDGLNIRDLVQRNGPLSLGEAISYALQIAEALRHAAEHRVVHRDVKPSNILVNSEGKAKLIDLGLARLISRDDSGSDLTASGVTLGTFDYISPEQARDPRIADVRSDIYSLGCTLFYMLAGRPPFPQGTVLQKLLQHQGDDPPDVRVFRPELPEEVARVVRKMMAKDPRRRFRDPARLIVALLGLAEQTGLRPMGLGSVAWMVPKQRKVSLVQRHLPWAAPAAVLVLIVLALDVVWSPSSEPDDILPPAVAIQSAPASTAPATREETIPTLPNDSEQQRVVTPPGKAAATSSAAAQPSSEAASPPDTAPAAQSAAATDPPEGTGTEATGRAPTDSGQPSPAASTNLAGDLAPDGLDGRISAVEVASAGLSMSEDLQAAWGNAAADPAAAVQPAEHRRWTVDPNDPGSADFSSLAAASHAVSDGDVIELRFNGRMEAKPLTLGNLGVTVRAGEGFQPTVVFAPTDADPIKYPRSMFNLGGTRLGLENVAIELDVPREVLADSWTLFEMGRADQVRLQGCTLTIRNNSPVAPERQAAYHPDVAFFRLKTVLGSDVDLAAGAAASRRASLELANCVARGEAVFLRLEDLQPVDLTWSNGLLVTTEWLLAADGGERAPRPDDTIQVRLEELTAVVGNGLCQLGRSEFAPHQLLTQIECDRCVLAPADARPACLIEQVGVTGAEEGLRELIWQGQNCIYGPFTPFWRMRSFDPAASAVEMTFDDWRSVWTPERESGVRLDAVPWTKKPPADAPVSTQSPADYVLARDAASDDASAKSSGDEAGLQPSKLPGAPQAAPPPPATPNP